jgi:hypothetical protein
MAALVWSPANATTAENLSFKQEEAKSLTAHYGDQLLWQFNYDPELPKPFFHPVAVPDGTVLTWNSPPDHRWHHGLWFSWKYINRVNYWEPNNRTGKPDGRTEWTVTKITPEDNGSAEIQMRLFYRTEKTPVLTEQRTITVSPPDSQGSFRMDWHSRFTAGPEKVVLDRTPLPDEPGGEVYGGYAGLSVRFAKQLRDRQATSDKGPIEFSPQSRYRGKARAMDYAGTIDGRHVGITICDHPKNINHPSPWYAIRSNVMSYYSPAVICYGPLQLEPGESFQLRYRIIVHTSQWDSTRIEQEYQRFVAEQTLAQ